MKKEFIAYFHCSGLTHISLGFHFDWSKPNIEIHLPFGFIRIGWTEAYEGPIYRVKPSALLYRSFGLVERREYINIGE